MSNNAISSSDPQALDKLKERLVSREKHQTYMKDANAHYKKCGTMEGFEGMTKEAAAPMDKSIKEGLSWEQKPFPSYLLTNNNAYIRRIRERINELAMKQEVGFTGWKFEGGNADANLEDNRLQLFFDKKPDEDLRRQLKGNGFKWAPSVGAWQRMLNDNAIYAAGRIDAIKPLGGESVRSIQPKPTAKNQQER